MTAKKTLLFIEETNQVRVIQEKVWNGSQSLNVTGVYSISNQEVKMAKVKVVLKRDSYDRQSYAKAYTFSNTAGWVYVASLKLTETEIFKFSHMANAQSLDHVENEWLSIDIQNLIDLATQILF